MKDQAAASAKNIRTEPGDSEGKAYYGIGGGCVHVGLNSRKAAGRKILLGIAVPAVIRLAREPAVKVIAISDEKATGVRCGARDSLAIGVFCKKARAL